MFGTLVYYVLEDVSVGAPFAWCAFDHCLYLFVWTLHVLSSTLQGRTLMQMLLL